MNMPLPFDLVQPSPVGKTLKQGPYYEQARAIRQRRRELRLSQAVVADLYGSQQGYISDAERGWVNFAGADLDWFRRMGRALQWDVRTLMRELDVQYVIAEQGAEDHESGEKPTHTNSQSAIPGYAVVVIDITEMTTAGVSVQQKSVVVPEHIASLMPLRGLTVTGTYLNAASPGLIAVYADVTPSRDDVVVIEIGGQQHLAYYTESGFVFTDRAIVPRMPQEFEPDKILGVVLRYTSPDQPRRFQN